jgi:hypothetical protein
MKESLRLARIVVLQLVLGALMIAPVAARQSELLDA